MNKYVTSIQIVVGAGNEHEAADIIADALDSLVQFPENGGIVDWAYVKIGGHVLCPTWQGLLKPNYQYGDNWDRKENE